MSLPSKYAVHVAFAGNAYFHMVEFLAADVAYPTHKHAYPHASLVRRGRVRYLREDGYVQVIEGTASRPGVIEVPAGIEHTFISETADAIVECVHMLRDEDGEPLPFSCSNREASEATARL